MIDHDPYRSLSLVQNARIDLYYIHIYIYIYNASKEAGPRSIVIASIRN